ncbi:MAG TPA: hypothetical protein VK668_12080 [Mucilaginibacter sp.]|nr:hypothetical protein [Mucilaginibacter sp.]
MNKLVFIRGKDDESNRIDILKALEGKYPDITFSSGNPCLIRGEKPEGRWTQRGKIISIILDESNLYINILSTYRAGRFSVFNGLSNYLKCKSIAKSFTSYQLQTFN